MVACGKCGEVVHESRAVVRDQGRWVRCWECCRTWNQQHAKQAATDWDWLDPLPFGVSAKGMAWIHLRPVAAGLRPDGSAHLRHIPSRRDGVPPWIRSEYDADVHQDPVAVSKALIKHHPEISTVQGDEILLRTHSGALALTAHGWRRA